MEGALGMEAEHLDAEDMLPDVNAQQISNSYFVNLDVSVMEVGTVQYAAAAPVLSSLANGYS